MSTLRNNVPGLECLACGEQVPNDPDAQLSGCKSHPVRMAWAPHAFTEDQLKWHEAYAQEHRARKVRR